MLTYAHNLYNKIIGSHQDDLFSGCNQVSLWLENKGIMAREMAGSWEIDEKNIKKVAELRIYFNTLINSNQPKLLLLLNVLV